MSFLELIGQVMGVLNMRHFLVLLLLTACVDSYAYYDGFLWLGRPADNNCYNYALGIQNFNYQQPGRASGRTYEVDSCEDRGAHLGVVNAAINDGLIKVNYPEECNREDEQVVALVVAEFSDYHWYRLEDDGKWTHKIGGTIPSDLDFSGNPIYDVLKADHGRYEDFCGYFCVDYERLKVRVNR